MRGARRTWVVTVGAAALLAAGVASAQAPAVEPGQPAPTGPDSPPPPPTADTAEAASPGDGTAAALVTDRGGAAKKPAAKSSPRRSRGCRAYASPSYRKMVRRWQTVPPIPKPKWRAGYRDLTLYSVNLGERIRVFPFLPDGTLDPLVLPEIARVMRDKNADAVHAIEPRLIKLVYKLAVKFNVRQITIISGYRQPKDEEGGGHHADGTAIDLAFAGVRLPALAQAARRLGHVGVGLYPTSGFVHLDVRRGPSYFWADRSGPGQPSCLRRLAQARANKDDARWRPELDEPVPARNRKGELLDDTPAPPPAPAPPTVS